MRAIILAAGSGSRLGHAADGLPKCLLPIGGRPLAYHQLEAMAEAGVSPVLMVIGYSAARVRQAVGARAEYAVNDRYQTTNSLASFTLARPWVKGPVVILNSDVLFDPEVLERVLRTGGDCLAYDSTSGHAPEHMKVAVRDGRVVDISKDLAKTEVGGENVGMICLSERGAAIVFERARKLIESGKENAFLAEAVRASLGDIDLKAVDVADLAWTEIDTPFDLEKARRETWARIQARVGSSILGWRQKRRRRKIGWASAVLAGLLTSFAGVWTVAASTSSQVWESLAVSNSRRVSVTVRGVPHHWGMIRGHDTLSTTIAGPRHLRIDLRAFFAGPFPGRVPYVVEIRLDGKHVSRYGFHSTYDADAEFDDGALGDRGKIDLEILPGDHVVSVRLVSGECRGVVVRFRVVAEMREFSWWSADPPNIPPAEPG